MESGPLTIRISIDLVQDLYIKELKGYKAPPAVRTPSNLAHTFSEATNQRTHKLISYISSPPTPRMQTHTFHRIRILCLIYMYPYRPKMPTSAP